VPLVAIFGVNIAVVALACRQMPRPASLSRRPRWTNRAHHNSRQPPHLLRWGLPARRHGEHRVYDGTDYPSVVAKGW